MQTRRCSLYLCSYFWAVRGLHGLGAFWHLGPSTLLCHFLRWACVGLLFSRGHRYRKCWIMTTEVNKYQRPSLSQRCGEHFLITRQARGQGTPSYGELSGNIWEIPLAKSFFCWKMRVPKVFLLWDSLMELEIIMSRSVNNCMLQWDICHPDMQYVFYPAAPCVEECSPQSLFTTIFWFIYH